MSDMITHGCLQLVNCGIFKTTAVVQNKHSFLLNDR